MRIAFTNNPIDRFRCWLSNRYEDLTQITWHIGHHKIECPICGEVLDSYREVFYPVQCGWYRIQGYPKNKRICHNCLQHRDFKPFIKEIDKREEKLEELWRKAREQEKDEVIF